MKKAWLGRFYAASAVIWPSEAVIADEISDEVFQALVEGRIGEMDDYQEDLSGDANEAGHSSEKAMRTLALAAFLKAMPDAAVPYLLSEPGAITTLVCQPEVMRADLVWALQRLIASETGGGSPEIIHVGKDGDRDMSSKRLLGLATKLGSTSAGQIVMLGSDLGGSKDLSPLLPEPIRIGPPDREALAAALSLINVGESGPAPELPSDADLRAIGHHGIRIAMRFRDRLRIAIELRRMADRLRASGSAMTLSDIAGYGEAEAVARRLVADLGAWSRGEIRWSEMPRAVLLHGEPGTGKTFLASAIAGSAGVPLITGSLARWQAAGHLGDLLREMRATFAEAREAAPSILFIDEIDSAGDRNGRDKHAENYRRQVVNALLELTDGTLRMEGVVLIAACNDLTALDPALIRPGRIDAIVEVQRPGLVATERILNHHARGDISQDVISDLARKAVGRTAAELDGAVRKARSLARQREGALTAAHLSEALEIDNEDIEIIRRVAIHEAGHAIAALKLRCGRVHRITISPAGGNVLLKEQKPLISAQDVTDRMEVLLAGRAAEELILASPSVGAGGAPTSDLALASDLALRLELSWGLTDHGILYQADPSGVLLAACPQVRARANDRLREAMGRVRARLIDDRPVLEALAERLVAERTMEPGQGAHDNWFLEGLAPAASTGVA